MIRAKHSSSVAALLLALSALALSGCGGGDDSAAPSSAAATTPPPTPAPPTPGNKAPTISGSAPSAINAGSAYNFTPIASDADGDTLSFSVQNKPSWATFTAATGKLSGTPDAGEVGTYSSVAISVSDGTATTTLGAFSIAVTAISNGRVTLSWTAPTENTDGTPLINLSGYKIHYGTSAGSLNQSIAVNTVGVTTYMVDNLEPATWYFAITAVTSAGAESGYSNLANKTI